MKTIEEMKIEVWADLCEEHAKMLMSEADCERADREESIWCMIVACETEATVHGWVRISLPIEKEVD